MFYIPQGLYLLGMLLLDFYGKKDLKTVMYIHTSCHCVLLLLEAMLQGVSLHLVYSLWFVKINNKH